MPARHRLAATCLLAASLFSAVALHAAPDGAAIFEQYCIPCHGTDGRARTPAARKLDVKDLTESKLPDADITRQIAEGKKDAKGKERMPGFRAKLDDPEIAALVAFVKSLRK